MTKEKEPSILVFNFPLDVSIGDIKTLFGEYGEISKINQYWIPWKMKTQNIKVFYKTKEECKKARDTLN